MTGQTILVYCGTYTQYQDTKRTWQITYAARMAATYNHDGTLNDRIHPDQYACPDRILYFRSLHHSVMAQQIDTVIMTGTWYNRPNAWQELSILRSRCQNAEWINDTIPLHVFAGDQVDYEITCLHFGLDPENEATFYGPHSTITPQILHDRAPTADVYITYDYTRMRRIRDAYLEQKTPTFSQVAWSKMEEWPAWLDAQDQAFLESQIPYAPFRRLCIEALQEIRIGHTWDYFARHKSQAHLECLLMYTHKAKMRLATVWADALMGMYMLCGGVPYE